MLLESLEYLFTPASGMARSLGFLKSSLQVRSRFQRCQKHWLPHLENTKRLILKAADSCSSHRKVALFGAGLLHDIPLEELSRKFREILLVDIVHPISSRIQTLPFSNVQHVSRDITGVMHLLHQAKRPGSIPLPESRPDFLIDDPELDLAVSVNLLSQLSWVSSLQIREHTPAPVVDAFHRQLMEAHLAYLAKLPGHSALITDYRWTRSNLKNTPMESWSVLHDIPLPKPESEWIWNIAPAPEREKDHHYSAAVAAYSDWKKTFLSL